MKSVFENLSDKVLFRFIKILMEDIDFDSLDLSQDDTLMQGVEESSLGIKGDNIYLDSNYIYNVWKLNLN